MGYSAETLGRQRHPETSGIFMGLMSNSVLILGGQTRIFLNMARNMASHEPCALSASTNFAFLFPLSSPREGERDIPGILRQFLTSGGRRGHRTQDCSELQGVSRQRQPCLFFFSRSFFAFSIHPQKLSLLVKGHLWYVSASGFVGVVRLAMIDSPRTPFLFSTCLDKGAKPKTWYRGRRQQ